MVPFVFGLTLGILGMIYLPEYVRPYFPESMEKKEIVLKGTVVVKEKKGNDLLMTVNTPEGGLLATFKQKTGEIELLINEKDEVQLTLPNYMPFINDPKIIRVVKTQQAVQAIPATVEIPATPAGPSGKSTKEIKSRRQVKPQTITPAPQKAMEMKPEATVPAPESPVEVKPQTAVPAPESPMEEKPPDQGNITPPADDKKTEQ
jgi:hypothetical protein